VELGFLLTGFINKKYSKTLLLKTDYLYSDYINLVTLISIMT
jgi:hypothetical protein